MRYNDDKCNKENDVDDMLRQKLRKKETRGLLCARVLVILSLLITAVIVSIVLYKVTKYAQEEKFQDHFDGASEKVLRAFTAIIEDKLLALGSIEVALIAESVYHNRSNWPFVSLPAFQQRAASAKKLSGCVLLAICPIVNETEEEEWQQYVANNSGWMYVVAHKRDT
jgi:hypothetical protein